MGGLIEADTPSNSSGTITAVYRLWGLRGEQIGAKIDAE